MEETEVLMHVISCVYVCGIGINYHDRDINYNLWKPFEFSWVIICFLFSFASVGIARLNLLLHHQDVLIWILSNHSGTKKPIKTKYSTHSQCLYRFIFLSGWYVIFFIGALVRQPASLSCHASSLHKQLTNSII